MALVLFRFSSSENYVRRNYSRDSKLIKLIGRIKAVRDVQRKRGSTLLDPKVIDALVSNLGDEWVSVKDRLPETKEKVLVTHRSGVTIASLSLFRQNTPTSKRSVSGG